MLHHAATLDASAAASADPFLSLRQQSRVSTSNPGPVGAMPFDVQNIVMTRKAIEHSRRAFLKVSLLNKTSKTTICKVSNLTTGCPRVRARVPCDGASPDTRAKSFQQLEHVSQPLHRWVYQPTPRTSSHDATGQARLEVTADTHSGIIDRVLLVVLFIYISFLQGEPRCPHWKTQYP